MRRPFALLARLGKGGWLPAGTAYAALAVAWAAPASLAPFDAVPNYGDPLRLGWVMAWDAHQLVRRPWALFDSNSLHPYPASLAFGDHLLPEALLVAPLIWATGNAVLAFNVAVVLALILSALAMFALVRGVSGRSDAAFLAGLAYAFNAFTQSELPRVHVVNLRGGRWRCCSSSASRVRAAPATLAASRRRSRCRACRGRTTCCTGRCCFRCGCWWRRPLRGGAPPARASAPCYPAS